MDIKTPLQRSENMSRIRSKNTSPEKFIRHQLFIRGFRYRDNAKNVPGHPDIYLPKYHTVIFVNGCFWHHHSNCKYAYVPKTNVDFWTNKFQVNVSRDIEVKEAVLSAGLKYAVIWECAIKKMWSSAEFNSEKMEDLCEFIKSEKHSIEI